MNPRLEVLSGPLKGRIVPFRDGELAIGRDPECHLVLDDGTVSRQHAALSLDGARALIRDLGSRNGIRLSGKDVKAGRLEHGEAFHVGRIELRFLNEPEPLAAPAGPEAPKPARRDWRFPLFLVVCLAVVAGVLAVWSRQARLRQPVLDSRKLRVGEELYLVAREPFAAHILKDPGVILEVLKVYPSALAIRAREEGEAELELPHADGSLTRVTLLVRGKRPETASLDIPPGVLDDPPKIEAFAEGKLAEARALEADGHLLRAFQLARGVEGLYRGAKPPVPRVAGQARDQAKRLDDRIQVQLEKLEEERRLLGDRKDYEGVERVLWAQRDLVEPGSASHQRLQYLMKLTQAKKGR